MSHPVPGHDYTENTTEGPYEHGMSTSSFKRGMKKIRGGLQKVVGHKRRERHESAKAQALKKKMN